MSNYKLLRQNYKQIRCYKQITQNELPSPQLLRFLNYDNSLSKELGVGLEDLSTQEVHDLIMSSVDDSYLNKLALEDLSSTLTSAANWSGKFLKDGILGFIRGKIAASIVLGGLAVGKILLGKIKNRVRKVSPDDVTSYEDYKKFLARLDNLVRLFSDVVIHIPDGFTQSEWTNFKERYSDKAAKKFTDILAKDSIEFSTVPFDKSHWTKDNFKVAVNTFVSDLAIVEKIIIKYNSKISKVSKWVSSNSSKVSDSEIMDISDIIEDSLSGTKTYLQTIEDQLNGFRRLLNSVGRHFEEQE
jgi:hypothetical protein